MNLNDLQHVEEHDMRRRVAVLEDRVAWLQDVLVRLLGEPDMRHLAGAALSLPKQAPPAPAPVAAGADAERYLMRTQPLPALGSVSYGAVLVPTAPAALAKAAPASATRKPGSAPAPAKTPFNLGITAAFETLDLTVAAAAYEESAGPKRHKAEEPMFELNPELVDTGRLRTMCKKLEVRSALEERYPSVMQNLEKAWQAPESLAYLRRLIREDQGGRLGFDPAVKQEILLLGAVREAIADH
jgi:hypothetical protein